MRVFTDGSGNGYACVVFGDSQETADEYFKKLDDPENHEYQAVLYALSLMDSKHDYDMHIDLAGVVDHIDGSRRPPYKKNPKIMELLQKIWKTMEDHGLQVNFFWIRRGRNPAGYALDKHIRYTRNLMNETVHVKKTKKNKRIVLSDRGSSNNLETKLTNPNRYAHWPKTENNIKVGCPKCNSKMNITKPCEVCGFNIITGKVSLEK